MKLTRNKIRKIRKQVHQSVRKWKKGRNSNRRRVATFRRSPPDIIVKRKNVFNKTLKKYIPLQVLEYLNEKYLNMRRMRRKQRRMKNMMGGDAEADAKAAEAKAAADAKAATAAPDAAPATADAAPAATATADAAPADAAPDAPAATETADPAAAPAQPPAATDATPAATEAKPAATDAKPAATDATPAATDANADDKKKSGGFNIGIDIPGDIPIHSDTFDVTGDNTSKLLEFLIEKGLPYYIQFEMTPGTPLKLNDTAIYDLYRILYGSFATKDEIAKAGDRKRMFFEPGKTAGVAAGDSVLLKEPGTDVYIFTTDVLVIDKNSQKNKITLVSEPTKPSKQTFTIENDTRLYKVDENGSPASIESLQEDCDPLGGSSSIKLNEIRLQISPLSDAAFKKAVATSSNDDGKKRRKVISDDGTTYVLNLKNGTKITSIQTLRKSLERVRASLENEDDISKTNASRVFETLNDLLLNPEFAKTDGYDEFKTKVFEFTYKIPGTERKYGFAQMMTFFEEKKDELPKDLGEKFTKLLTLLDHGPAGANGSCVAFNNNHALEVIEYTTTLENGDIVTTKKLGSKMNIEGFGDKLDKLNDSNKPKEEEGETKAEGGEGDGAKKAEGSEGEGAKAKAEGVDGDGAKKAEGSEGANKNAATAAAIASAAVAAASAASTASTAPAPASAAATSSAAAAAAAAAAAVAVANKATAEHILPLKEIPKEPLPPSQEVVAINKLYEKYDKKKEKIGKILYLRQNFDKRFKEIVPLLLDIFKRSNESYKTNNSKENTYNKGDEYNKSMKTLKGYIESFKKSETYKYVEDTESCCDKIVSELIPNWYSGPEKRANARKICPLFTNYAHYMMKINESYDYFNHHQNMKPVIGAVLWGATKQDIESSFNNSISTLEMFMENLEKDETYTKELKKQLLPETAQQVV